LFNFVSFNFAENEQQKPIRVYADIVGDLLHAGHFEFFKKAREFGDYLIVGVLADESVEEYKRTPILTLEERVKAVQACRYVDEVIIAPPLRASSDWLEKHNIDYVIHGDDFSKELVMDQYGGAILSDKFKTVPYTKGISTTEIIKRIVDRYKNGEFQN